VNNWITGLLVSAIDTSLTKLIYGQQMHPTGAAPLRRRGRRAKSIGTQATTGTQLAGATPMAQQKVTRRRRAAKRGKQLATNGQTAGAIVKRGRKAKAVQQVAT